MLLQTNSYVVPKQHRLEHAQLLARFRQALARVGCDLFEVYEQADANWDPSGDGRFVQIMRFRDREHQQAVRAAERMDLEAHSLIEEFCRLINFPYQQEQGLFAVGFYTELEVEPSPLPVPHESPSQGVVDPQDGPGDEQPQVLPLKLEMAQRILAPGAKPSAAKGRQNDLPPGEDELDELLHAQFVPASPHTKPVGAVGDPDLGRVLDAGLALDDLDIPMEAELLDEPALQEDRQPVSAPKVSHQRDE